MLCSKFLRVNAPIYCRIQEAITRQQGLSTSLYRDKNPVLSLCSLCSTYCSSSHRKPLASSSSNAMFGDVYVDELISSCSGVQDFVKPAGVHFKDRTQKGFLRAGVSLRKPQQLLYSPLNFGSSTLNANWRIRNSSLLHGPWLKNLSTSSPPCCLAGAAHDVSFDTSPSDDQLTNSSTLPNLTNLDGKTLKLLSVSCYLPHPDKEATGGEDAHFICSDKQAIGVADGVGGWANVGVNAGLFAQELISNSVKAVQEEPKVLLIQ